MAKKLFCALGTIITLLCVTTSAQVNDMSNIPDHLLECYQNRGLYHRENRLPMTISTLIELIWNIEQYPGFQMDIQDLALSLIQMFRVDGIEEDPTLSSNEDIFPFKLTGPQFERYRLLVKNFIPRSNHRFINESLSTIQKCSLHFMLSNSIDKTQRGDEDSVCSVISGTRFKRNADLAPESSHNDTDSPPVPVAAAPSNVSFIPSTQNLTHPANLSTAANVSDKLHATDEVTEVQQPSAEVQTNKEDPLKSSDTEVDIIDPALLHSSNTSDQEKKGDMHMNADGDNLYRPQKQVRASVPESKCPVENGVIYTPWGSVSTGALIAGIAAGLAQQSISTQDFGVKLNDSTSTVTSISVDNQWVATLSGDLAEVVIKQVPANAGNTAIIGVPGAWNSTQLPKYYFIGRTENLEMTDAEIRGAIDGLILSTKVKEWNRLANGRLTLSSLLERYYSTRGMFDPQYQACKRQDLYPAVALTDKIKEQTLGFAAILQASSRDAPSITPAGLRKYSDTATSALNAYVPSGISASCPTATVNVEPSVDLLVVIDCAWRFEEISAVLQPIREQIKAPWRSNFTVFSGMEFQSLMNSTNTTMNRTDYSNCKTGFDLKNLLSGNLRTYYRDYLDREKNAAHTNSSAMVVLFIPFTFPPSSSDLENARETVKDYRKTLPDVTFLYLIQGNADSLQYLVEDRTTDGFTYTDTKNVDVTPIVKRLEQAHRRITNPACGSDSHDASNYNLQYQDIVNYQGINYYRIHPKYLFPAGDVSIKFRGDYGALKVCYSRSIKQPNNTDSSSSADCTITSGASGEVTIKLSSPCSGYEYILQCPPLYISVQSVDTASSYQCKDDGCRSADDVMYTITHSGLTCGVGCFLANPFTLTLGILVLVVVKSFLGSS